jgi:hypothetical protein
MHERNRGKDEGRRNGGAIGFGIGAIALLPFGPIAMCTCSVVGILIGYLFGWLYDFERARARESIAERELRRLSYLVRYATDQISRRLYIHASVADAEFCMDLLESVIKEFRPVVRVAHLSSQARKKLRLFHSFLSRPAVLQCLWMYVNGFIGKWAKSMTVGEFVATCETILRTLVDSEVKLGLTNSKERLEVIIKVEHFLSQPLIRLFLESQSPQGGSSSVIGDLEVLLVRDLKSHIIASGISLAVTPDRPGPSDELITETPEPRAFFRSFKDFMEFDIELKHRIPITADESRFILEKEAEPLDSPGWDLSVNKANIKVLRYIEHESHSRGPPPPVLVRAYATVPNTTVSNIFYHIMDPVVRTSWDKTFDKFSMVPHAHDDECAILYCTIHAPVGVSPRDFLQYRKSIVQPGLAIIMMRSAEHADKPPTPGYIRAESLISGYVIRQRDSDCELFLMSQTDIKGLIPKWMVNMFAAKAPAQWVENLVKSCQSLKTKQFGGDETAMNAFLEDYMHRRTDTPPVQRFNSVISAAGDSV